MLDLASAAFGGSVGRICREPRYKVHISAADIAVSDRAEAHIVVVLIIVNGSLPGRIFGCRMSQTGRMLPVAASMPASDRVRPQRAGRHRRPIGDAILPYGSSSLSGSSASKNPERVSVKRAAPCVVSSRTGALMSKASSAATKRRKNSKAATLCRVVPCSAIDNFGR